MPILAALFVSVFGSLAGFLAAIVGRKVAVAAASIAVLAILYSALFVAFNSIVSPLVAGMFSTSYGQALGLAFPPCAGNCLAALGGAWAATTAFGWNREALRLAAAS